LNLPLALASISPIMNSKLFSIVLPTLNVSTTLRACLESIAHQTCTDYEIIVVDGGSTDDSLDIVQSFSGGFGSRLIVQSGRDEGIFDAMNRGVTMSSGAWIYFVGADDTLYGADILARVADFVAEHQSSDLVYGDVFMKRYARIGGVYDLDRLQLGMWPTCHQAMFYRRALFTSIGPYSLRYPLKADWDFNIRCFSNPALVARYMDIVVAHVDDSTGFNKSGGAGLNGWPDKEMEKRLPGFIRWSALGMFRRELARLRGDTVDYPSAAARAEFDEEDARWVLDLAQSYFDLGDFANARDWFTRRVDMGGCDEDVHVAMVRVAESMEKLGASTLQVQAAFQRASEFRQT